MNIPLGFRPMLAINYSDVKVQPKVRVVSEKLNGVRVVFFGGVAYSRSLIPLPNKAIQALAHDNAKVLEGCDGEVIAGLLHAEDVLHRTTSLCMKKDKVDDFCIYLFDCYHVSNTWIYRYKSILLLPLPKKVKVLEHFSLDGEINLPIVILEEFEQYILSLGGEGVIIRDIYSKYKCNRSGKVVPELQKVKRFTDSEFPVVSYNAYETNSNEATRNGYGLSKRSTSKKGKRVVEILGSLTLALQNGSTFSVGSGMTMQEREDLWLIRDTLIGKMVKVKYFMLSPDNIPLLPIFLGIRNDLDM